jgi:S1-C subfamily serine protease
VAENSPASQAGLQEGDIITKIGDVALDETHSYVNALFEFKPGDQITLEVVRGMKRYKSKLCWEKHSVTLKA